MVGSESTRWRKLRDYFLRVGSCPTWQECMRAACIDMLGIIPFDVTTGIMDMSDDTALEGFGQSADVQATYNRYYRKIRPRYPYPIIDWLTQDGEYVVDFLHPNSMYQGLRSCVPGHRIHMSVVRSRRQPAFDESDAETLAVVDDFLNNLCSSFDKRPDHAGTWLSAERIADRFGTLSPREAEVCSLVASRFTTAEIAARLFISRRTVENHVANVFAKLDVRSREQPRYRLGALPF